MQDGVLKVVDPDAKQKDTDTEHKESMELCFRELVCQPVGMNYVVIATFDPETSQIHA